ncbi:membrane protein insertase YidC [Candidatus Fermentibacteria bacterium]|nr:membrane protein insertase YidC [Candidatus Fermentibacteria bacterium]
MSDQQRLLLASVLMALVLVLGWNLTARRSAPQAPSPVQPVESPADSMETPAPPVVSDTAAPAAFDSLKQTARSIAVLVRSEDCRDLVRASVTTLGGAVESWTLPEYRSLLGGSGTLDLVAAPWFVTTGADGSPVTFGCEAPDTLVIAGVPDSLVLVDASGARKVFTFEPDSYTFIVNTGGGPVELESGSLPQTEEAPDLRRYFSAAWYAEKYRNSRTGSLDGREPLGRVLWAAARSRYFAVILMSADGERDDGFAWAGSEAQSPGVGLEAGSARVYAGPVDYRRLRALGSGTDNLVDLGWPLIRWIGRLIYLFLSSVLSFIGNWGLRIVVLSVCMKALLWPLSWHSARSMRKMQALQPKMQELQKKYPNDPLRQRQELQKIYREHGVNPLGGCLPLLLQMPVFFALYRVLESSVDLRGAGFVLWIKDLSRPEILIPFGTTVLGMPGIGLLAVLMGASMYFQQKMTMSDPSQRAMAVMMPVLMTWLFMRFPAGLTIYWFVNSALSLVEQRIVRRDRGEG